MYDKLFGLSEITKQAIFDPALMQEAATLLFERDSLDDETFAKNLFDYSAHLSATIASMTTQLFLTEEQMSEMLAAVNELDSLGQDS